MFDATEEWSACRILGLGQLYCRVVAESTTSKRLAFSKRVLRILARAYYPEGVSVICRLRGEYKYLARKKVGLNCCLMLRGHLELAVGHVQSTADAFERENA